MITSTNFTEYGIHSTGERYVWITYLIIVLLSSLIGDSIILIATVRYNAIKLNKFLVVVMQHIAVCDVLSSITYVLPTMISLIANRWILGDVIAYMQVYLEAFSFIGSNILICILTCIKLMLLKNPIKTRYKTTKNAHMTCACAWMMAFLIPGIRLAFDNNGLSFSFIEYNINFGSPSEKSKAYHEIVVYTTYVFIVYIPTVIVIVTTFWIVIYLLKSRKVAKRTGSDQRWQGMVVVLTTAIVYSVSVIPGSVTFYIEVPHKTITRDRVVESLVTLNIISNFYIYSLTIPSFRNFIRLNAWRTWGRLVQCIGQRDLPQDSIQLAQNLTPNLPTYRTQASHIL